MTGKEIYPNDAKQRFFYEEWGRDLFKYPEEGQREKQSEKEKESCICWFKRFLKEEWLPTSLSDNIHFILSGVIERDWTEKKNYSESGFIIRYILSPYLFQLEQTRTKVLVGVKKIDSQQQVERERRISFATEMAKDIFQEGVVQSSGKELVKPHILVEADDLVWGWWSPAEKGPIYDNNGNLVGYDLGGESPNQVVLVMFQSNGTGVRYEIEKKLPPWEVFGFKKKSPGDYRNIDDLIITEEKTATYITSPGDRFFETLLHGELFNFPGEEVMREYPQPPILEKHEIIRQIEQIVKREYLPSDLIQHLFYVPKAVKEVDWSSDSYREKDGFIVRYLINSHIIQLEKTSSTLFISAKPSEMKDYLDKMLDRINMVREVAEGILRDGIIPKRGDASFFCVKIHRWNLTYGWWKPLIKDGWLRDLKHIKFQTDGYAVRFEI